MKIHKNHTHFDARGFVFFLASIVFILAVAFGTQTLLRKGIIPQSIPLVGGFTTTFEKVLTSLGVSNYVAASPAERAATKEENPKANSHRFVHIPTIEEQIPETGKFVGVDLQEMKVSLYKDKILVAEYPVLSKGRPGSRWETPSGSYSILYKNPSHFSSIGEVYMPWSMQFYGNFFIHGVPYYPNGTEVGAGFSGGCVRLNTPDAKSVFEFADMGTPIYIYDLEVPPREQKSATSQSNPTPFKEAAWNEVKLPRIGARSFIVADLETGEVFAERNSDTVLPIASITKLMTALVANETISYSSLVPITQSAFATYGSLGGLELGERLTTGDMYYPLLLSSSNDAATALAEYRSYSDFVRLMNQKARALDMQNTTFDDPSGLSPKNTSTALDLFKLSRYLNDRKRFILDITTQKEKTLPGNAYTKGRTYNNSHPMKERPGFLGGKNGYTDEARKTLVSLFKVPTPEGERSVAIIVLGTEDIREDTLNLLEWTRASLN